MVPRVKVLGVFSRDDGELVADLIEIPVECTRQNQVSLRILVFDINTETNDIYDLM